MPDITAIGTMIASFKSALDLTKAMAGLANDAVMQTKVIELQRLILEAQGAAGEAQGELLEHRQTIADLRAQLAVIDEWKTRAADYELADAGKGRLVYRSKTARLPHFACPACFEDKRISILQPQEWLGARMLTCTKCEIELNTGSEPIAL